MKKKRLFFLLFGFAAFSCVSTGTGSCSGDLGPAEHGELAQGTFSYKCTDDILDPVCENLLGMTPYQAQIAVGAEFSIWYVQTDSIPGQAEPLSVQAPFESVLEREFVDGMVHLRFLEPGSTPIHASTYADAVYDFVHLEGIPIDQLMLAKERDDLEGPGTWNAKWEELTDEVVIEPGQVALIRVFPLSEELHILPGSITEYEWTPPDKTIAALSEKLSVTNVLLTGISLGTTSLEVELNGLTKSIDVIVAENLDGGTDAGSHFLSEEGRQ